MVKQLIGSMRMHFKRILTSFLILIGAGLFGTLPMSVLFWVNKTETSRFFCLGTITALIAAGYILFWDCLVYRQEFMLALSMGQTRREFMITYALRQMLWVIAVYITILLMNQLEQLHYRVTFAKQEQAFALSFLTDWKVVVPLIPALALLPMFMGALLSRFGTKFGVIIVIVWFGWLFFIPRVIRQWDAYAEAFRKGSGVFSAWIFSVPPIAWTAVGIAAVLAMAATIRHLGMKQAVC